LLLLSVLLHYCRVVVASALVHFDAFPYFFTSLIAKTKKPNEETVCSINIQQCACCWSYWFC
jgi:hypothetical protein